jgi:hypothetical protein
MFDEALAMLALTHSWWILLRSNGGTRGGGVGLTYVNHYLVGWRTIGMMTNDELLALVRNADKRDSWRWEALGKLVANLAVDHLYRVVLDTNRKDEWRKFALDAICEIATLRGGALSLSSISLQVGNAVVVVSAVAVSVGIPTVADLAADVLYKMVNDTNRKDAWRYQCLKYLITIGHKQYLTQIANNTNRKDSWRDEAIRALIHG